MNPITYISSESAPFLIQHGTADRIVPFQQSQILYDALKAVIGEGQVTLSPIEGAGHGGGPQFWISSNVEVVLGFLDKHLR